jgi:hypothetical protein
MHSDEGVFIHALDYLGLLSQQNKYKCFVDSSRSLPFRQLLFQQLFSLTQLRTNRPQRAVDHFRIVRLAPRQTAVVSAQLTVEMEEAVAGLLGHADGLLEQVGQILDMSRLLAEETLLQHGGKRIIADLGGEAHQPLKVLEDSLFYG